MRVTAPSSPSPAAAPDPAGPSTAGYGSPRAAALAGLRDTVGAPALVLAATYLGFGSLVRAVDQSLLVGLVSTVTAWAIPGQIAVMELYALGAPLLAIAVTVGATNMRLLPMVLALFPGLRDTRWPRLAYFAAAHVVAITGWVQAMQRCPTLPSAERLPYFAAFSGTLWVMTMAMTAIGWSLADTVPPVVSLGLVFLNPIYFLLILSADLKDASRRLAMILGAIAGPAFYVVDPEWGLPAAGLIAGTAAFLLTRKKGPT